MYKPANKLNDVCDGVIRVGHTWELWPKPCHSERPVPRSGMCVGCDDDTTFEDCNIDSFKLGLMYIINVILF